MMNTWLLISEPSANLVLGILLSNTALAGLLGLLILGLGWFLHHRPSLRHMLWLIVLVKLITPPVWQLPVLPQFKKATRTKSVSVAIKPSDPQATVTETPTTDPLHGGSIIKDLLEEPADLPLELISVESVPAQPLQESAPIDFGRPEVKASSSEPIATAAPSPEVQPVSTWMLTSQTPELVVSIWALGSGVWFLVAVWRIARFQQLLRQSQPAPQMITDRMERLAAELGLRSTPRAYIVTGTLSPCVWSLTGRPVLIVPEALWDRLDQAQQEALLLHELAHIKRRDPIVRMVELASTALHWWNPILWWARRGLHQAEEQCCDAWVVHARPGSTTAYAQALVETLDFLSGSRGRSTHHHVPMGASGLGRLHHITQRITMIMKERLNPRLGWKSGLIALAVGGLFLPIWATWANSQSTITKEAQAEQTVIKRFDSNGQTRTTVYDSAGRLVSENNQGGPFSPAREQMLGQDQLTMLSRREAIEQAVTTERIQTARLKKAEAIRRGFVATVARLKKLESQGSASAEELEKASSDLESADADVEIAKAELNQAVLRTESLKKRFADSYFLIPPQNMTSGTPQPDTSPLDAPVPGSDPLSQKPKEEAQKQQLQRQTDEKIMQRLKAEIDAIRQENAALKQQIEESTRKGLKHEDRVSSEKPQ